MAAAPTPAAAGAAAATAAALAAVPTSTRGATLLPVHGASYRVAAVAMPHEDAAAGLFAFAASAGLAATVAAPVQVALWGCAIGHLWECGRLGG